MPVVDHALSSDTTEHHAAMVAQLQKLQDWLREPEHAEHFGTQQILEWINRRPTHIIPAALGKLALSRLASVSSASAEGFVLVPREPTEAMIGAGRRDGSISEGGYRTGSQKAKDCWASMIAASPTPEPVPATNQAGEVEAYRRGQEDMRERAAKVCDERGKEEQEGYGLNRAAQNYFRARNAVRDLPISALATQPATSQEGEGREVVARLVYEAMQWAASNREVSAPPSWVRNGNSFAQCEARTKADRILALTPDATQTREAELVAALEAIANLRIANDFGFPGCGPSVAKFARAALNARGGA